MKKAEIRKVVEKEYQDMRKWDKASPFRYSKLMYDTSDGEVWADVFLDEEVTKCIEVTAYIVCQLMI